MRQETFMNPIWKRRPQGNMYLLNLFGIFVMTCISAVCAAGATVSVLPSSSDLSLGSSVMIDVSITDVTDLYGFQFDLAFDTTILQAGLVSEGTFFVSGGNWFPGIADNTGGTVTFIANSLSGPVPGIAGTGQLATIVLDAVGLGSSSVVISNVVLLDSSLAEISLTRNSGGVVRVTDGAVPEPSTGGIASMGIAALVVALRCRRSLKW